LTNYEQSLFKNACEKHQAGELGEAEQLYRQLLESNPNCAEALNNLGNIYRSLGKFDTAEATYRRAIACRSDFAEAYGNLGLLLQESHRFDESMRVYQQALLLNPASAECHFNLGILQEQLGHLEEAKRSYENAIQHWPDLAIAYNNLGNVLKKQGDNQRAVLAYSQAIEIFPENPDAYFNLAISLNALGQTTSAIDAYERALALRPDHPETHFYLAITQQDLKQTEAAIESLRRAHQLRPGYGNSALLHALQSICDWKEIELLARSTIECIDFPDRNPENNFIYPLSFLALPIETTAEQQQRCAKSCIQNLMKSIDRRTGEGLATDRPSRSKIVLGYLSGDYRMHPVGYLIPELIESHDRTQFEVIGYSLVEPDGSAICQRIAKAFDRFVQLDQISAAEAAMQIAKDQVDILIDLQGHTREAKTEILAYRPAPIQVNYLGYAGTMGADFVDYILADEKVLPANQRLYYTEKIVHLPGCFMVNDHFREIDVTPMSRGDAGIPENAFVFCAFSSSFKITPTIFDCWLRLLNAIPKSVLWLRITNPLAIDNLGKYAMDRGIDRERLIFAPNVSMPKHLARHRLADLYLDTFPYNQHSTASDAIRMGVPLITIEGQTFPSRVASSLLQAVGMPELVTRTAEEYERLAIQLASQPPMLSAIRSKLEANLVGSPLFDGSVFAKNVEKAFRAMWELHQRGESPKSLSIAGES